MNWFSNLFNCFSNDKEKVPPVTKEEKRKYPTFKRTYIEDDIYKPTKCNGAFWDVTDIRGDETHLMQKIYQHIIDSKEVLYFTGNPYVAMLIWTERFGWCRVVIKYDMMFFEFCVPKNGDRYDINYEFQMKNCPDLYNLMKYITEKAYKEYKKDKNL